GVAQLLDELQIAAERQWFVRIELYLDVGLLAAVALERELREIDRHGLQDDDLEVSQLAVHVESRLGGQSAVELDFLLHAAGNDELGRILIILFKLSDYQVHV